MAFVSLTPATTLGDFLAAFKTLSVSPAKTQEITGWIYKTADALVKLEEKRHPGPVINVLQARVLAVAIMLAEQITEPLYCQTLKAPAAHEAHSHRRK